MGERIIHERERDTAGLGYGSSYTPPLSQIVYDRSIRCHGKGRWGRTLAKNQAGSQRVQDLFWGDHAVPLPACTWPWGNRSA